MEPPTSPLSTIGLFAGLSPADLLDSSAHLRRRPCASLHVVESDQTNPVLASPKGRALVLNTYGPGDGFGELSLLDGEPRSAGAIAESDCQLLVLGRDDFIRCLDERPRIAIGLLASDTRESRRSPRQVHDTAFQLPARLAEALRSRGILWVAPPVLRVLRSIYVATRRRCDPVHPGSVDLPTQ